MSTADVPNEPEPYEWPSDAELEQEAARGVHAVHPLDGRRTPPPRPRRLTVAEVDEAAEPEQRRMVDGGSFLFDQPDGVPAVWGEDDRVLWAQGEALWIVGPPGVGKTTVVGQLVRARVGLADRVIDWPVLPGAGRLLYLAMDRPAQIARALRRHFQLDERQQLAERLVVWKGPPPMDLAAHPDLLVELAHEAGADTVVIDSMKDAALKLTDDEVGAGINRAIQTATAAGIEVVVLHHQRKGQGGTKPNTLEDVYGSTWLTAGAGSVLLLWGKAGDLEVELVHLKQPASDVGPLKLVHDHTTGTTSVSEGFDPLAFLRHRRNGATANEAAEQMFQKQTPNENDRKKAQRRLDALVARGLACRIEGQKGGASEGAKGSIAGRYYALGAPEELAGEAS